MVLEPSISLTLAMVMAMTVAVFMFIITSLTVIVVMTVATPDFEESDYRNLQCRCQVRRESAFVSASNKTDFAFVDVSVCSH